MPQFAPTAVSALVGTEAALVAELARAVEAAVTTQIDDRARAIQAEAERAEAERAVQLDLLQSRLNALAAALHQQAELSVVSIQPPAGPLPQGRLGNVAGLSLAALLDEPLLVGAARLHGAADPAYLFGDWGFFRLPTSGMTRLDPPLRLREADDWALAQAGPPTVAAILVDRADPDPTCLGVVAGTALYAEEAHARAAAERLSGEVRLFRPPRSLASAADFVASQDFARYCGLSTRDWLSQRLGLVLREEPGDAGLLAHDPTGVWTPALDLALRELRKGQQPAERLRHPFVGECLRTLP
jgi:hypothetical protein